MRVATLSLFVLCSLFGLASAAGADSIGTVRTYQPEATIVRDGAEAAVDVGSAVHTGDRLVTRREGAVGIAFIDGSILSLGPQSEYVIEEFRFRPAKKEVSFLSTIEQGTVTFLSGAIGRISPQAVLFKTPTATLGLRGAKVLIEVEAGHAERHYRNIAGAL
jgi:hypothetical protein